MFRQVAFGSVNADTQVVQPVEDVGELPMIGEFTYRLESVAGENGQVSIALLSVTKEPS